MTNEYFLESLWVDLWNRVIKRDVWLKRENCQWNALIISKFYISVCYNYEMSLFEPYLPVSELAGGPQIVSSLRGEVFIFV